MSPESYSITAQRRDGEDAGAAPTAQALREQGLLPVVVYGHGLDSASLSVEHAAFRRLMREAGRSSIVMLNVDGEGETRPVLVQDVQYDPVTDEPIHADFYQVRMDEKIETTVPLIFTGESRAVEEEDGVLVKNVQSLEIRALPTDLPHEIEVSIDPLKELNDAVRLEDLALADGVEAMGDPDMVLVSAEPPRSEEELEALEETPMADVEDVERVGEEEEEGEELAEGEEAVPEGEEAPEGAEEGEEPAEEAPVEE